VGGEPAQLPELHVREAGQGPTVLLLHGLGGDHTVYNLVIPALAEQFHVLAPDLRGHGGSPLPGGSTFAFDELAGDLDAMLAARRVERYHLVGMSAGGFLGLRMLLDRPQRLLSFTGIGTAAQCDGHTRAVASYWAEVYRELGYEPYVMRLLKDLFYPEWLEEHPAFIEEALVSMRQRDLGAAVQWGLSVRNFDVRGQLGRVRTPLLVLHGMDDRVIDASHARLLRQAVSGAELKLMPFAGHMLPIEKPEEVAHALKDFLTRVGSSRPG
jgi:3-oxoadipate enol-lactonase